MPRLSWTASPREATDWDSYLNALSAERDLAVFCDNSAFDDNAPAELWKVLLSEPKRLMLVERVIGELAPWLKRRPNHPVAIAIRDGHPGIGEWPEPKPGEAGGLVFDYYVFLLALRRATLEGQRRAFRREHGRDPSHSEDSRMAAELQKNLGTRGRLIATKRASTFTDEVLVYLAVEHALTTGRQTLILTQDADVEEQYFKLLWLIDTHYRGMLLADRYVQQFGTFKTYPMPASVLNDPRGPFEPHDAVLVERDLDLRDMLPPRPHCVGISCLNAGVYSSQLRFMAETEMARLLNIKEATGGRSTDRLGKRNLHASVNPVQTGRGHDCAAVVYDRRKPAGMNGATVAVLDMAQAIVPCEQHAKFVPIAASPLR